MRWAPRVGIPVPGAARTAVRVRVRAKVRAKVRARVREG